MLEEHTKKDIEKISIEILKGSKSLDVFPTPIDKIVEYSDLIVRNDIDVSQIHRDYIDKANDALKSAVRKVRGALDRREKTIYLDLSQKINKRGFVKLHEVGHHVLPWQKNIHSFLEDDDDTLSDHANEDFESEANYFSSVTLFQHDRFLAELNKYKLELKSSIQLSRVFGASVHATLRRYVEHSKNRCALIVLEKVSLKGQFPKCFLRDLFQSDKFTKTFGELSIPNELGYTWEFVKDYYHQKRFKDDGSITLSTKNGEADFTYHFFFNGYNAFVFLFPFGEKKSSKTKIVISESIPV